MAQFKYLAVLSEDPGALAGFYRDHLGLIEIARSQDGDVSLTDGFCHFAFFRMRAALNEARLEPGLHHVGLQVEDLDAVLARYKTILAELP